MADTNAAAGPASSSSLRSASTLFLANADITRNAPERQQGVASMWQGLSSEQLLDQRSRILIFSDSLSFSSEQRTTIVSAVKRRRFW